MTAHHDKLLYGKLTRMQSELSDDEIENAVALLNARNKKIIKKVADSNKIQTIIASEKSKNNKK